MRAKLAQRSVTHSASPTKCIPCGYSTWRESPPTNHSACKSDLPQMISLQLQVVGITSRQILLVGLNHNLDLDVMLILPFYRVPPGWGLLMKAQLMVQLLPRLMLWFFSGVMKWEAESFLGYSILKSEHSAEDRVTVGCFALHWLLHRQTCKHRASTIKIVFCTSTDPKSLGIIFHDLDLLSHQGKPKEEEE